MDPQDIEFDNTFVNDTDSALITISNQGDSNLVVFPPDFASQAGNFLVEDFGDSLIIESKQNTNLGIYFTPQSGGAIYDTLHIYSNDPLNMEQKVSLQGVGVEDTSKVDFVIDVSVDTLDFDTGNYFFSVEITKEGAAVSEAILYLRPGGQKNFEQS